jgi:hypothetical protein
LAGVYISAGKYIGTGRKGAGRANGEGQGAKDARRQRARAGQYPVCEVLTFLLTLLLTAAGNLRKAENMLMKRDRTKHAYLNELYPI